MSFKMALALFLYSLELSITTARPLSAGTIVMLSSLARLSSAVLSFFERLGLGVGVFLMIRTQSALSVSDSLESGPRNLQADSIPMTRDVRGQQKNPLKFCVKNHHFY